MNKQYVICLADYESILTDLAEIIEAEYKNEHFLSFEEEFHASEKETAEWFMVGKVGQLAIKLEKFEGYYFSTLQAQTPAFEKGKELLWKSYLSQGGNPDTQEKP